MIDVTSAIMEREGKYLIAQRKKGTTFGGRWEFPGGKIKKRETPEECLHRELREEFGINSIIGNFFGESTYDYGSGKKIRLVGYFATYVSGEFVLNAHDSIKWVYPYKMEKYDFLEADRPFVKKLIGLKLIHLIMHKYAKQNI